MSLKVFDEKKCNYSVHTYVNLGKSINDVPQGWALNLSDIREFIPVLRYEFECYIMINGIISPCKIKINPRLFYKGTSLRNSLRKLKKKDPNKQIPLEIKFNKTELDKSLDEFDVESHDYIDTKLLVGKSFSSKGWGLSKDVVSKIFPLDSYNYMFPVYINGIPAENRINIQTRLFYSSKELSKELERLYKINPKQKVNCRIILNENYLNRLKSIDDEKVSNRKCVICGDNLNKDSKSEKCFNCLDKELTVLKLKSILNFFEPLDTFYEEDLIDLGFTKGKARMIIRKLKNNELVSRNWDESYKLKNNATLNKFINEWGK